MECIPADKVDTDKLEIFFEKMEQPNVEGFRLQGYVVLSGNDIIGCFELDLIESKEYWLKKLYINQNEVVKLPVLLEYILLLAREKEATAVYAHSEQPVTDLLLESMSFSLQDHQPLLKEGKGGNWWAYKVS